MKEAKRQIVRLAQWDAFPEAMKILSTKEKNDQGYLSWKDLNNSFPLKMMRKLNPFMDNGVMRAGGRLRNSELEYDSKHPMILPPDHSVTKMIISELHEELGHSGVSHVLNTSRRQYWIIRGRAAVRKVLAACFKYCMWGASFGRQRWRICKARVVAGKGPFNCTGVDLMGPLVVKQGRNDIKRYVVLFTCLATRAVQLEIAQSL